MRKKTREELVATYKMVKVQCALTAQMMGIIKQICGRYLSPDEVEAIAYNRYDIPTELKGSSAKIRSTMGSHSIVNTVRSSIVSIRDRRDDMCYDDGGMSGVQIAMNKVVPDIVETIKTFVKTVSIKVTFNRHEEAIVAKTPVVYVSPNWTRSVKKAGLEFASDPRRNYAITKARRIQSAAVEDVRMQAFEVEALYYYKKQLLRTKGYVFAQTFMKDGSVHNTFEPSFATAFDTGFRRAQERLFKVIAAQMEG
jgi:hypothetical protein